MREEDHHVGRNGDALDQRQLQRGWGDQAVHKQRTLESGDVRDAVVVGDGREPGAAVEVAHVEIAERPELLGVAVLIGAEQRIDERGRIGEAAHLQLAEQTADGIGEAIAARDIAEVAASVLRDLAHEQPLGIA